MSELEHAHDVAPGQECPACHRRVPHPKKATSPKSRPKAYRVPEDEREAHDEVMEQAAKYLGIYEAPFWQFKLATLGATLVLQDPKLKDYAQR